MAGLLLAMSVASISLATPALSATPDAIDLGTLGGTVAIPLDVDGTVVVGSSATDGDDETHAFAYDLAAPAPSMRDLGTLGGSRSQAVGVSGDIVVGNSNLPGDTLLHAFVYDLAAPSPSMRDLGTFGGNSSAATAISGSLVVGFATTAADASYRAFAYDLAAPVPTMRDIGNLGGNIAGPVSVSGNIVAGTSHTAADPYTHAFAYDLGSPSPTMRDIGHFGGGIYGPVIVSGTVVVGSSWTPENELHAFAYDLAAPSPSMRDLGTLGGRFGTASAVTGTIVAGQSEVAAGDDHAFAYDLAAPSPSMRDLGTLGGTQSGVVAAEGNLLVGYSYTNDTDVQSFVYDLAAPSPSMRTLGGPGGSVDGSVPTAISGDIVVGYGMLEAEVVHAVAWDVGDVPTRRYTQQVPYSVWTQPTATGLDAIGSWILPVNEPTAAPGQSSPSYSYAHAFLFADHPAVGMVGIRTDPTGKSAVFTAPETDGTVHQAVLPFEWTAGRAYFVFVRQLGAGQLGAWIYDSVAATWTLIGVFTLPPAWGKLSATSVSITAWHGPQLSDVSDYPRADVLHYPAVGYVGEAVAVATLAGSGVLPGDAVAETSVVAPWARHRLGADAVAP